MTIASQTNRTTLTGNGVTTDIPVSFPFHAAADLVVIETIIATGVQTTKTITTHYTVTGTADAYGHYPDGGTVVMVTAPASTVTITVYRDVAATQGVDPTQNDPLPVDTTLESPLDRLTMIAIRLKERLNRSLRQPEGDSADIDYLPSKVDRASKYLTFDSDGDPTAAAAPANTTAVSAFAATILDDTTAAAARATQKILVHAVLTKTATYAVVAADDGKLIDCTSGTFDVDLLAAATAGAGFAVVVKNSGTGVITIDPDGAELIDGAAGLPVPTGGSVLMVSDGSAWKSVVMSGVQFVFDSRTATVAVASTLCAPTSGTPAVGIGTGQKYQAESADEAPSDVGQTEFAFSDIDAGTEDSYFQVLLRVAGAALTSCYRFVATGAFNAIFTHANTAARTYTLPDRSGTIGITLGTEAASTSGTSIDFTGIPAGTRRITIMFKGVSTSGTNGLMIQLGDAGDIEATGYLSQYFGVQSAAGNSVTANTTGFILSSNSFMTAGAVLQGRITLELENAAAFSWVLGGMLSNTGDSQVYVFAGSKSLSAELTRLRITTLAGSETFDAGAINISYEM